MKPDDAGILWIEPPQLGLLDKIYLPAIFSGLGVTAKHAVHQKVTVQFPEERHVPQDPLKYRGVHRLNRDDQGRVKCVACFLCATACPAHCIEIVAAEAPKDDPKWADRDKYPSKFVIDELRCIYCG